MMITADLRLLRDKAYVAGQWIPASSGRTFPVVNPSTNQVVAHVPDMDAGDTVQAIEAAATSFDTWKRSTVKERCSVLKRFHQLILENRKPLSILTTLESGKALTEAYSETDYAASFVEWFAEEGRHVHGDVMPYFVKGKRTLAIKQPIGVAGLITPWNFPLAMVTRKLSPALAAGCSLVLKPSEETPLTALALAQLAEDAGLAAGVLNVITCSRQNVQDVGAMICSHQAVATVSFTGSSVVGKDIYRKCADSVKRVSLELGGNAPFIVFESADVDAAVKGLMAAKFKNCGQTCISVNRIFVHENIHDVFVSKLLSSVHLLKSCDGLSPGCNLGPLINMAAVEKVERHVADALSKGAVLLSGGARVVPGSNFFAPTVLTGCNKSMQVYKEESFGPLCSIFTFSTEDEVIQQANDTNFGLAAYMYSEKHAQMWRVAEMLDSGMVGVNEGAIGGEWVPFGGFKESGIGKEGSKYGLDEFLKIKAVTFGGL